MIQVMAVLGTGFVVSIGVLLWVSFLLIGDLLGAPYVPTTNAEGAETLRRMKMRKGRIFMDIGSGDGRMVLSAVRDYQVSGVGFEIHPYLVLWSRLMAQVKGARKAKFKTENFWNSDLSDADYIYFYLGPWSVRKLAEKLIKEKKKPQLIVSKAFEIKEWKNRLKETWIINNRKIFVYGI